MGDLLAMSFSAVILASVALGSLGSREAPDCKVVTNRSVETVVEVVLAESNGVRRWEKAGDLAGDWMIRCPLGPDVDRRQIGRTVARWLVRPELRMPAAIILYQLGADAIVSRQAIHAAYLDDRRMLKELPRGEPAIGPLPSEINSLRCLDQRLRGRNPAGWLCEHLESFSNPERSQIAHPG
jgi:hypothetical protein